MPSPMHNSLLHGFALRITAYRLPSMPSPSHDDDDDAVHFYDHPSMLPGHHLDDAF